MLCDNLASGDQQLTKDNENGDLNTTLAYSTKTLTTCH